MERPAPEVAETCLLLLSGLPGAGKTTLARSLVPEALREGVQVRHVCFDALGCQPSSSRGGSGEAAEAFSPEAWQLARQAALAQLEMELAGATTATVTSVSNSSVSSSSSSSSDALHRGPPSPATIEAAPPGSLRAQNAASGVPAAPGAAPEQQQSASKRRCRLVVADDNLQYRSMRWRCCGLARTAGAAVVLLHVRCSQQVAQERNAARPEGDRVPAAVISRMAAQFEAPGAGGSGEGSSISAWERTCLVECSADHPIDAAAVWQQVRCKWGAPAPLPYDAQAAAAALAAAQAATAASRAHAVDVATRQVLSRAMQRLAAAAPAAKAAAAQRLSAARRRVLQEAGAELQQAAAEEPAVTAERWAAAFEQCCQAVLASLP